MTENQSEDLMAMDDNPANADELVGEEVEPDYTLEEDDDE